MFRNLFIALCLLVSAVLPVAAQPAEDGLRSRYPELSAEDLADPAAIAALEDRVNAWFDAESETQRAPHLKALEGNDLRLLEAVVRHGRRYSAPEGPIVGNITLPPRYDPAKPIPILIGFNNLTTGWERDAVLGGFGTMNPWGVEAWVDPRATDEIVRDLWKLSRRVNIDFDRLYATGVSVGGHGTWVAACARSDVWAAMLPISGSPGRVMVAMGEAYMRNVRHLPVRTVVGAEDTDIAAMANRGFALGKDQKLPIFLDTHDGRGHESFDDLAGELLTWALKHRRPLYPAELEYYGGADLGRRHYWVEALKDSVRGRDLIIDTVTGTLKRKIPVFALQIAAGVKDNVVSVRTKQISSLRVSLSPSMVDFTRDVTVKVNGRVAWKGKPEGSARTLLESSLRRMDRSRTFLWEMEFEVK